MVRFAGGRIVEWWGARSTCSAPVLLAAGPVGRLAGCGRRLSARQIATALRRAGRQRRVDTRAEQIRHALRAPQLTAPAILSDAYGDSVEALVAAWQRSTSKSTNSKLDLPLEQDTPRGVQMSRNASSR